MPSGALSEVLGGLRAGRRGIPSPCAEGRLGSLLRLYPHGGGRADLPRCMAPAADDGLWRAARWTGPCPVMGEMGEGGAKAGGSRPRMTADRGGKETGRSAAARAGGAAGRRKKESASGGPSGGGSLPSGTPDATPEAAGNGASAAAWKAAGVRRGSQKTLIHSNPRHMRGRYAHHTRFRRRCLRCRAINIIAQPIEKDLSWDSPKSLSRQSVFGIASRSRMKKPVFPQGTPLLVHTARAGLVRPPDGPTSPAETGPPGGSGCDMLCRFLLHQQPTCRVGPGAYFVRGHCGLRPVGRCGPGIGMIRGIRMRRIDPHTGEGGRRKAISPSPWGNRPGFGRGKSACDRRPRRASLEKTR